MWSQEESFEFADAVRELIEFSTLFGTWLAWESLPIGDLRRAAQLAAIDQQENLADAPPLSTLGKAVSWLRSKVAKGASYLHTLGRKSSETAFKIAGEFRASVVEQVKESLANSLQKGDTLEHWMYTGLREIAGTRGIGEAHAETIYRTVFQTARQEALLDEYQSSDLVEWIAGYEYLTMEDGDRVCEICEPLQGRTFKADDPDVLKFWPPNHFNCRCQFMPIDRLEARTIRWSTGKISKDPAKGFVGRPQFVR